MPRTRRFFQVRIGGGGESNPPRVADVVLHIRRKDLAWFDDEKVMDHVLDLLQTAIVPRLDHDRYKNEVALGPQGIPILDNNKAKTATTPRTMIKRTKKPTKQELAERARLERERAKLQAASDVSKEAYYASNDTVKLVYKWEACLGGAVLVLRHEQRQQQDEAAAVGGKAADAAAPVGWIECAKFPKRLQLWCYPAAAADLPAAGGEGLLRPELIPLADLFRQTK